MISNMKINMAVLFFILISPWAEGTNDIQRMVDSVTTEGSKISTGIENLVNQCGGKENGVEVLNDVQKSLDLQVITFHLKICFVRKKVIQILFFVLLFFAVEMRKCSSFSKMLERIGILCYAK